MAKVQLLMFEQPFAVMLSLTLRLNLTESLIDGVTV
jgi:hypothetical protein